MIQPQFPHNRVGHTIISVSGNECRNNFEKNNAVFQPLCLISWLCSASNTFPRSSEVISGRSLNKGMTVVHLLALTCTSIEPQLPHNMTRNTTRIASKNENRNISHTKIIDVSFPPYFLLSSLRIATNTLFKSSEITPKTAPSDTHITLI